MKKTFQFFLILLCPLFAFPQGFIIKGSIDGLQSGIASIDYHNGSGEDTTVKARITDGKFTLSGKVAEPEQVRLTITEGWSYNLSFFLENSVITIHMVKDASEKTVITGSASNVTYERLKPGLADFFENARQNAAAHQVNAYTHDTRAMQAADSIWSIQQGRWIQSIRAEVSTQRDNYAALYYIQWLMFRPGNFDSIRAVFMQLSPSVRKGWAAKKFLTEFDHVYRISLGALAPEISGTDTTGKTLRLSSFRGRVILLDFWASFCGPCRQENKRMLPFYQKYHEAGFEIVSFSLDDQRARWTSAILADGMIWPQASELRGGASATANMYDITDLPRNVLIDKRGKIYAKDLHGDGLTEAVEKLLKGK